jgi:hypothetical protein
MPWTFPRPSVKALAIGAATLVVAWLAGWAALGLAFADRAPAIAASSPVGAGPATGKWARLLVALTIDPRLTDPSAIFPKKMPARSVALARKAFSVEPMSADALVVLAMAANANGDARQSQALFRAVNRLTRRNGLASMWLAEKALEDRDVPGILGHFDEILRTNENGRANVLQRFAAATPDPVFARALAKLLRRDPPWAEEFWQVAPTVKGAAGAVGELRLELASSGLKFDSRSDSALAEQLLNAGRYDLADRLYRSVAGSADGASGDRVRDGQFTRPPKLPPVDWAIFSAGDYGAEIRPAGGALLFAATTSIRSLLARQWISLSPGRYVLSTRLSFTQQGGESGAVYARLTCIGTDRAHDFALRNGSIAQTFAVGAGDCRNYWLDILAEPGEGSTGLDGSLDYISIKPA